MKPGEVEGAADDGGTNSEEKALLQEMGLAGPDKGSTVGLSWSPVGILATLACGVLCAAAYTRQQAHAFFDDRVRKPACGESSSNGRTLLPSIRPSPWARMLPLSLSTPALVSYSGPGRQRTLEFRTYLLWESTSLPRMVASIGRLLSGSRLAVRPVIYGSGFIHGWRVVVECLPKAALHGARASLHRDIPGHVHNVGDV